MAETKRYQLAKRLSESADHVLLLTATPHHGDEDRFAHFLRLIDPDLFPEPHRLGTEASSVRKDVLRLGKDSPWCLRRLKEDLKDLNGRRLFPDRYTTCEIHGGMNPHERKRAQEQFRAGAQVCVATEAAGEGINLQFCHLMINYDMPWNPTRLEQRLGRIHRIGQERDVYAFNFVATDSEDGQPIVEGPILHRLLEKLQAMNEALDGRVFDVVGEVLSLNDVNLPEMLREAAYDPRRLDEYLDQIDRMDPAKLKEYEVATGIALARSHVDFTGFQHRNLEVEEKRLMPAYVEAQFLAAAREVGLRVEPRADGLWRIEHVPADLRSERLASVQRLGKADPSYRKVTFHKHHLEQAAHVDAVLMGPGHPLYAALDEKLNEKLAHLQGGIGFYVDPETREPYRLHFFETSIRGKDSKGSDIRLHGQLVAVREQRGQFEIVPSDILLNLPPHPKPPTAAEPVAAQAACDYLKSTYQLECRDRCKAERHRFARICREYLERSFMARIKLAQERAMALMAEAAAKAEFKLAADEARKYVEELERTRNERPTSGIQRSSWPRPIGSMSCGTRSGQALRWWASRTPQCGSITQSAKSWRRGSSRSRRKR